MLYFESAIEISYVWVFLVVNIFLCAYLFYFIFKPRIKNELLNMLSFSVLMSAIMAVNRTTNLVEGGNLLLYNLLNILTLSCCTYIFFIGTWKQYLFSIVGIYLIYAIGEIISVAVIGTIHKVPYLDYAYEGSMLMIGVVVCNMYILLFVMFAVAVLKIKREHVRIRQLLVYIVFPIYQTILVIGFYSGVDNYDWVDAAIGALIMIFSMIVDVIVIHTIDHMAQSIRTEEQMLAMQLQRQTENEYRKMTKHYVAQMQAVKQELSKQMKKAYDMIATDAKDTDITGVLDASLRNLQSTRLLRYCDNNVVNSVFTVKKDVAQRNDIPMKITVTVPENLPIEKIDLCSLYSNLLDNAIEAEKQIPDSGCEREIVVKSDMQAGFLIVKVENTKSNPVRQVGKVIKTSKKDDVNHGLGLQLVQRIAKKYDGLVTIDYNDDVFSICVSLRIG